MAPDPVAERVAEIVSGDPLRVRRALHAREAGWSPALERRLIAHVAPLLGRPALAREAEGYLRRVAPRSQGQLVDGLLDRSEALPVRLALARILSSVPDVRAMMGLRLGLDDPDFAVRRACAEGCVRLVERRENLAPPKAEIHARMEREITALEAGQGGAASGDALEQIFSLLALLHGRDTARSTQTGVRSDNPRLRGTALEFLESVLPPGLWGRVSELIRSSD